MEYFIGIDNSSLDHKVQVIDENGKSHLSFTIENSLSGFETLHAKIGQFATLSIGFELPHGPLIDYLHSKGYELYSVNPLKIKRFKESLKVSGNKNDAIDALAISEYLRHNKNYSRKMPFNSSAIENLKLLSVVHTRLTQNKARHLNKLHFAVRQYFPLQEILFGDFGCTVQLELLRKYPTFSHLKAASDEEISNFLKVHKYRVPKYIKRVIERIRNHKQLISPEVEYVYQIEAINLCNILCILNEDLKHIEQEMESITESHPAGMSFKTLPGAGPILSSKLLAIFGDNAERFDNYQGARCLFGTAPKNYQSGPYHKVIMRKACNKSARAILFQFAFSSIRYSSWAREYYDAQRKKGKTHSVAVRALSNKWVKIIFKLWREQIIYKEIKKAIAVA